MMASDAADEGEALAEARERARARVAAEAGQRAARERRKVWRGRAAQVVVVGVFVVMLFERAVNGGWF